MLTCTGLHNPDRARTHLLIILALRKERLAEHKFKVILYLKNGDLSRFLETLFHSTYIHYRTCKLYILCIKNENHFLCISSQYF